MGEQLVGVVRRFWFRFNQRDESRATVKSRAAAAEKRVATVARHAKATIAAHWGTVLAIVISVAAIYLRELFEDKALRVLLLGLHRQMGLLVLIIVPIRVALRYRFGFKDYSAPMHALFRWAASASHAALYAGLVMLPLLGWASTSAHNVSLTFLGLVQLPGLAAADSDMADALSDYHAWSAYGLGAFIVVHALAALWHHFYVRDNVLVAMLGGRVERRRAVADRRGAQRGVRDRRASPGMGWAYA